MRLSWLKFIISSTVIPFSLFSHEGATLDTQETSAAITIKKAFKNRGKVKEGRQEHETIHDLAKENPELDKKYKDQLNIDKDHKKLDQIRCDLLKELLLARDLIDSESNITITGGRSNTNGFNNDGIYYIKRNKALLYVIKFTASREELEHLLTLKTTLARKIAALSPQIRSQLPVIVLDEGYYITSVGSFAILHGARGARLDHFMSSSLPLEKKDFQEAFPKQLAWLAAALIENKDQPIDNWKTYSHQDLNGGNIFYNKKYKRVYLIDTIGVQKEPLRSIITSYARFLSQDHFIIFCRQLRTILKDEEGAILKDISSKNGGTFYNAFNKIINSLKGIEQLIKKTNPEGATAEEALTPVAGSEKPQATISDNVSEVFESDTEDDDNDW